MDGYNKTNGALRVECPHCGYKLTEYAIEVCRNIASSEDKDTKVVVICRECSKSFTYNA